MDQLDVDVARQVAAERQAHVIRAAEQRRMLRERAAAQPEHVLAPAPPVAPRPSFRSWLSAHLHVALHRPAVR